jgi:hypothetical protein
MRKILSIQKSLLLIPTLLVILAVCSTAVLAQTAGKIAGTVTDQSNGEALVGANVTLVGTTLGASTDAEGRYFVLNVPPGVYTVRASFIGYKVLNTENVIVSVGITTEANFSLEISIIEGEEIVITSEPLLVEKSLTATASRYSTSELNNALPVSDVKDILENSPSVYRGFIRGGNKYETKTLVDGVDVTDTYFSQGQGAFGGDVGHSYLSMRPSDDKDNSGLNQSQASLQEIQVFAGTFNAEYPAATAGIINVVTREGGQDYSFNFYNRTLATSGKKHPGSNIYHDRDLMFEERDTNLNSGNPNLVREGELMTWTVQDAVDNYNYDPEKGESLSRSHETSFTFSGPLGEKGGFFLEGNYSQDDGAFPFDRTKNIGGSVKLHYNVAPGQKLTGKFQLSDGGELFISNGPTPSAPKRSMKCKFRPQIY